MMSVVRLVSDARNQLAHSETKAIGRSVFCMLWAALGYSRGLSLRAHVLQGRCSKLSRPVAMHHHSANPPWPGDSSCCVAVVAEMLTSCWMSDGARQKLPRSPDGGVGLGFVAAETSGCQLSASS